MTEPPGIGQLGDPKIARRGDDERPPGCLVSGQVRPDSCDNPAS